MSPPSWQSTLTQTLNRLGEKRPFRLAVLGVGHELRGDDGAGLAVARGLRPFASERLLVDAAQMDEPPGTIRWLAPDDITGVSASSHTLPLHMLARFLQAELGCEVALLGIQPADTSLGAPLSESVETAVSTIIQALVARDDVFTTDQDACCEGLK